MHEVTELKLLKAWKKNSSFYNTMDELEKSMSALNKGKARYPHGLCEEIFQIQVLGTNLKESLLLLLNKIKEEGVISSFMK